MELLATRVRLSLSHLDHPQPSNRRTNHVGCHPCDCATVGGRRATTIAPERVSRHRTSPSCATVTPETAPPFCRRATRPCAAQRPQRRCRLWPLSLCRATSPLSPLRPDGASRYHRSREMCSTPQPVFTASFEERRQLWCGTDHVERPRVKRQHPQPRPILADGTERRVALDGGGLKENEAILCHAAKLMRAGLQYSATTEFRNSETRSLN